MLESVKRTLSEKGTVAFATTMLGAMGVAFSTIPRIRRQLKGANGHPYSARLVFRTFDGSTKVSAIFDHGMMTVRPWAVNDPDVTLTFSDEATMRDQLSPKPKKNIILAMLDGDLFYDGNLSHLARFSYLVSEINRPDGEEPKAPRVSPMANGKKKQAVRPKPMKPHAGVKFLEDPALSDRTLDDYPRVKNLWEKHFTTNPAICSERAKLVTDFHKTHGLATGPAGQYMDPVYRQGRMIEYLLKNKQARVEDDDLLLGTTTTKRVGVPIFPEFGGVAIWPELHTMDRRRLNPYDIDDETKQILNEEVFPYWIDRNVREVARKKNGNSLCQRLEEKWVLYFTWKTQAISHTIPDFPTLISRGLLSIRGEAQAQVEKEKDQQKKNFHEATVHALDGVLDYAERLADEAARVAKTLDPKKDAARIKDLKTMAARVRHAPAHPARTFAEALSAMWIVWVCLHQENFNAGLSIGRLDMWLQPYLAADLEKAKSKKEQRRIIDEAVELGCAFFLKCQDHLPLVPDIGNRLFGGSSSDQVVTLGGVDRKGASAVCDATYIWLKVTELIGLRDPNVNARYNREKNPKEYLRRLVEVNAITCSTPSLHNDQQMISALQQNGFTKGDARDWSATGCVEPTSCGRHFGHTGGTMFNLVAPLELSLYNGVHPLVRDRISDATGDLRNGGAPKTFEGFLEIYKKHLGAMIDHCVDYNNQLGYIHQELHPTPLLSSLMQGTTKTAKDVTFGGAKYNTSGTAMVALVDVVDSLMAVKKLVYDDKKITWNQMLDALEDDFQGHEKLLARIQAKVPRFGGPDPEPREMAERIMDYINERFAARKNYRGGKYFVGFWSMSNHVAFGVLSGALPSGRRKGKAFTPGLTPSPEASKTILDPLHTVASLDPVKMQNNIAFNVKLFPAPGETMEKFVDMATDLTSAYMEEGGMQMQYNIVTTDTLRDAIKNPAAYRNLLVRISGYNAYFVELNKDMQAELIERAEYRA